MSRLDHQTAHFHIPHLGGLGKISWNVTTGTLAGALVNVFIPIYLLRLGFGASSVFIYFAVYGLVAALSTYFSAYSLRWVGGQKMLILSDITDIVAYILLATLPSIGWPLVLIASLKGISKGVYWPSFHAIFSKNRDKKQEGNQIGLVNAVLILGSSLGPVIGGILATSVSLTAAYAFGVFLMAIGALPLFYGKDFTSGYIIDMNRLNLKNVWRDFASSFGDSINKAVVAIAWPLIISLYVVSYAGIGLLASIVTVTSVVVTLYVGKKEKLRGEKHYLSEGSNLAAGSHIVRAVSTSPVAIVGVNMLNGLTDALMKTPYTTRYYANADKQPRIEYIVGMEISQSLAWACYGVVLAVLALFLPLNTVLTIGVLIGIPGVLGVQLIR